MIFLSNEGGEDDIHPTHDVKKVSTPHNIQRQLLCLHHPYSIEYTRYSQFEKSILQNRRKAPHIFFADETRLNDIRKPYSNFPQAKRQRHLSLTQSGARAILKMLASSQA